MADLIKLRADTAANWASVNPVLANKEPGYDKTNNMWKIGDGTTAWSSLSYVASGIANGSVTLAQMANMATSSLIYRKTAGSGAPEVNTLATLKTDLGLTGTNSGDQTITLTGDVTGSGTGSFATAIGAGKVTLAMQANMATASVVYRKTAGSGAPEVQTLATLKTDLGLTGTNTGDQTITLTGPITGSGTGSFATSVTANAITDAMLAQLATGSFKGRVTAGTGNVEVLTGTQATTLLDTFTTALKGLAPASGGGTTNFLRADGTWAAPPGGTTTNALTINNGGAGAASGSTFNGSAAITISYNSIGAAPLASPTFTGKVTTAASATGGAGLNLPHGAAPTTPANGDTWTTTTGAFYRINGATVQVATGTGTATGTNTGDQTITLTGDVTGSGTGSFATAIGAGKVTLAMQANMATASVVYRKTAGAGAPEVQTLATLKTDLGLTGTNSGDQTITLTGDITGSGTGSFATTIGANKVTYAMMQDVSATSRLLGRITAGAGDPEELTGTQATTLLDTFTSALKGLAPASGGGTTNFLRADGTWAAPPGGGGSGTVTSVSVVTANGVSGSVATATTTPAITLLLGDITPTSAVIGGTGAPLTVNSTNSNGGKIVMQDNGVLRSYLGSNSGVGQEFVIFNSDGGQALNIYSAASGRRFEIVGGACWLTAATRLAVTTGAQVLYDATNGGIFSGGGSTYDLCLQNNSGTTALRIPTGTTNVQIIGTITASNLSGTNTGDQTITLTGDVTGSGTGSFATTIGAGKVTLAMQANLAANSIVGNNTGSAATPIALTAAQTKTLLAITESDVANLTTDLAAKAPLANPQFTGVTFYQQVSPTAKTATGTLTIAELQTLIITVTSATAVSLTLPTGTLSDAGILSGGLAVNEAFEWYIINLGSSSGATTLLAGTGHTLVGNAVTAIGTSSRWLTRKTATNTFVTYRIA